ncbi:MAG: hypothetical protein JO293_01280, partial [Candidatus Eremiobacteraeota bacterium]|nr:hypothetical protein [Candidatus Eremiobacteraeota bacterium]
RDAARRQLLIGIGALALFSLDVGVRLTDAFGLIEPVFVSATGVVYLLYAPRLGGDPPVVRASIEPNQTIDQ